MSLWKRIYFWYLKQRTYFIAKRILNRKAPIRFEGAIDLSDPDYDFKTGSWNS